MGKKHNKKKFNHLADPQTYNYSEFKSINGGVNRKYIYNNGSRSDAFGRNSEKELWSNPYNAWKKYNTSGLMPQGLKPSTYHTIRNYNSISYNSLKDAKVNTEKSNKKKVIPKNTISSGQLLDINLKVAKSEYNNHLRNLSIAKQNLQSNNRNNKAISGLQNNINLYTSYSPSFFYASPTKYTRDYFGSTLYKGNNSDSTTIADLEKNVKSQYWIPKSDLPQAQGHGIKVYRGSKNVPITEWHKYYPKLPYNYYNYSFL